jgi:type VI secretion system secreted protein VgrG
MLFVAAPTRGQSPSLGSGNAFAVLAASTVTSTGNSVVAGDVGVAPGTAITGFPPATATGSLHMGDPIAVQAQADVALAYSTLTAAVCTTTLTGQDLGGMTLAPGVYCYAAAAQLTGTLTLDAAGNAAGVFVIKTGSTLTTAVAAAVVLINGANAENVFWQVGSSATFGAATHLVGNVMAQASITAGVGAVVTGRLIALTAAVNMDTSQVSLPSGATTASMGPGCGNPAATLTAVGLPTLGNTAFAFQTTTAPAATVFLFQSFGATSVVVAPGCTVYLDSATFQSAFGWNVIADGAGANLLPASVPNVAALTGLQVFWQAAAYIPGAPVLGNFAISNGLVTVIGA